MAINEKGLKLIRYFEGLRLRAYRDPVGILTIGYGRTGPDVQEGQTITEDQADQLLEDDLVEHETFVKSVVTAEIDRNQRAALTSFAFNVGNGNLKSSTLLKKLNDGDGDGAADQFLRWVYGTKNGVKVKLPGLVLRRAAERSLFLGEDYTLGSDRVPVSTETDEAEETAPDATASTADSYEAGFAAHVQGLGLRHFKPYELLVLGHQHHNPHSNAYGLNRRPPSTMWSNIDKTVQALDRLREVMGAPIATLSVYRSPAYNEAIGGAGQSQHVEFNAIDFVVKSNSSPSDWAAALRQLRQQGVFSGGIGTYSSFVHIDTRGHTADW